MKYNPQISISAAPGITQYLRLALYEATAPLTEVASSGQLAPPHNASRQLQFLNLNPVIHIAKLYVTDGVSTTGTIIANFSIDPKYPGVEVKAPLFIYAGTTPGFEVGDNFFSDPDNELDGWDYEVEIRGFGLLNPESEVDKTQPGTGYTVTLPDYENTDNVLHIIYFAPKLITVNADTNPGGDLFSDAVLVTEDVELEGTDFGKMHLIAAEASKISVTLPGLDTAPPNKLFLFSSGNGNHVNAIIKVADSDNEKIDWLKDQQTQLILGQSELLWVFKWVNPDDSGDVKWKVANASDGIKLVGEKVYSDKKLNSDLMNAVFADGSLLDRDVYVRLWNYVQTLDPGQVCTDAEWNTATGGIYTNKGKFSAGDGSTTFRVPQLAGFLKGVNGTDRSANSYENQQTQGLYVQFDPNVSQDFYMNKISVPAWAANWYAYDDRGDASSTTTAGRTTGLKVSALNDGSETRPANTGQYILIRC